MGALNTNAGEGIEAMVETAQKTKSALPLLVLMAVVITAVAVAWSMHCRASNTLLMNCNEAIVEQAPDALSMERVPGSEAMWTPLPACIALHA